MINEHDKTKLMLNQLRNNPNAIITERMNPPEVDNKSIELNNEQKKEEEGKLNQIMGLSMNPNESSTILYPHDNNVITRGVLTEGLAFEMSIQDGIYITASSARLTSSIARALSRLDGNYEVWSNEWVAKLPDYKNDAQ